MKLAPPSLQHVVRVYRETPEAVKKELLKLAYAQPPFSYEELYELVLDLVCLRQPIETIQAAVSARIKLQVKRDSFLRVLPLVEKFFRDMAPKHVLKVEPRSYSIGRDMRAPFAPPMICVTNDHRLVLPWFIFWKKNPLTTSQLSLFVSIVDEILEQDSDLEQAKLLIIDMSTRALDAKGNARVIDAQLIPRLSYQAKSAMLETIAEGFALARSEWGNATKVKERKEQQEPADPTHTSAQTDFFRGK